MSSTLIWKFQHGWQRSTSTLYHSVTTEFFSASITTECQEYSTEHLHGGTHKSSKIRVRFSSGSSCASDLYFKTTFLHPGVELVLIQGLWLHVHARLAPVRGASSLRLRRPPLNSPRSHAAGPPHSLASTSPPRGVATLLPVPAAPTEPRGRIPFDKAFRSACLATIVFAVFAVAFSTATLSTTDLTVATFSAVLTDVTFSVLALFIVAMLQTRKSLDHTTGL